jgi:hypothetical protein
MSHPNTPPNNPQYHSAQHISTLGPLSRAHITQLPNPVSHQGGLGSIPGPPTVRYALDNVTLGQVSFRVPRC